MIFPLETTCNVKEDVDIVKALLAADEDIPILREHDITELELDDALTRTIPFKKAEVFSLESLSLNNSNGGRSIVLEKLGKDMQSVKEAHEKEKANITESVQLNQRVLKTPRKYNKKEESSSTVILDLRKMNLNVKEQVWKPFLSLQVLFASKNGDLTVFLKSVVGVMSINTTHTYEVISFLKSKIFEYCHHGW